MSQETLFDSDGNPSQRSPLEKVIHRKFNQSPDRPILHKLHYGDTVTQICKRYNILPRIFKLCNTLTEINDEIIQKRKFVVIPANVTFNEQSPFDYEYGFYINRTNRDGQEFLSSLPDR